MMAVQPDKKIISGDVVNRAQQAAGISAMARVSLRRRMLWALPALFIFLADQISKWMVMERVMRPILQPGQMPHGFFSWYLDAPSIIPFHAIEIMENFNLVMAWNTGISFSMLDGNGMLGMIILIVLALCIVGLFVCWFIWTADMLHALCFAVVIGGALGNVLDRLRFGAVIDFLDFHIFGYHWPAFNIADMAVVGGVITLIMLSLFFDHREKSVIVDE